MSDLHQQLQRTLGERFLLERELGSSGTGRVFLARETALGRQVVIKLLPPDLACGMFASRFTREIQLAVTLQQPNIVPLLSTGVMGDVPWYTMPFVRGQSLRERLERRGRLPVRKAVRVLRDMARALSHAHARGVMHRNITPENVLLSGSGAVVKEFGIANAIGVARARREGDHIGASLGTPAYMAPEQARGDPATDHRADLYAWGVVAYEMFAGTPPFQGTGAHQLVSAHVRESPAPLRSKRRRLHPAIARLVMRCLAKDAASRPASADALLAELDAVMPRRLHLLAAAMFW